MTRPVKLPQEGIAGYFAHSGAFTTAAKELLIKAFGKLVGKSPTSVATYNLNATLAAVPGLSWYVKKGKKYHISGTFNTTAGASGGVQLGVACTNQSSPTFQCWGTAQSASAIVTASVTSLGKVVGATVAVLGMTLDGDFTPDANGVLTITGAQNASNGTDCTIKTNSLVQVYPVTK